MKQVIKNCEGHKKKTIQALKTKTIGLYHQIMNTERMVTGIITQNPILTAANLFEAKREICEEIRKICT